MTKILIVEDDPQQARALARSLRDLGYGVDSQSSARDALLRASTTTYDLILLDWMLPDGDGVHVCRQLRVAGFGAPVLMLTARADVAHKLEAFDSGADDYVVKPYDHRELAARIQAQIRRWRDTAIQPLKNTRLTLSFRPPEVRLDGERLFLTQVEFALLALLMEHAPRTITRRRIVVGVWGERNRTAKASNVVDVHIAHLREKLRSAGDQIQTVRGIGYRMQDAEQDGIGVLSRARALADIEIKNT